MNALLDKFIDPYMSKKEELLKKFELYSSKKMKTKEFLDTAKEVSIHEIREVFNEIKLNPSANSVFNLLKTLTNTGSWISTSYIRYLHGLVDFSQKNLSRKEEDLNDPRIQKILNLITNNEELNEDISDQEIFRAIYNELEYSYHNPKYISPLEVPNVKITLMLVSGVLNEVFSTPAFDRGAKHLLESHGIKYVTLDTRGTKGTDFNTILLKDQIRQYIKKNSDEKLWLVGFSKGGLDSLHYLAEDSELASKHFLGISTIATPIMGTEHLSSWILRSINSLHKFSDSKIYKYFDAKVDILAKDLQKSLSSDYLKNWFENNHEKLPKNIFYTAVAFESDWLESHLWMKLAKLLFYSDTTNDGVVDAKNAFFPDYFPSKRLGIVKGHHLVGIRSSYYSQEALFEAHLIYLKFKGLIK